MRVTAHREPLKTAHPVRERSRTRQADSIHRLRTEKLGASRTVFARLLKVSENTFFRWETGKVKPDSHSNATLEHVNRVCDVLLPSMNPTAITEWLERPNPAIDNFRPIDLIEFEYGRQKLKSLIEETGLIVQAL